MTTRRLVTSTAVAAVLALGLAGCVKMDVQLELQPDDTVDGSMVFAVSSALVEMSGEDPEELVAQMQEDMLSSDSGPANARTEKYDDGDFVGTTTYFDGEDLDLFATGASDEALQITREGGEFVVAGVMDMTEMGADGVGALVEGMDIRIAVTFPGAVSDHNGSLEGTTVTWEPVVGERLEMSARGSAVGGGAGSLPLPLLIGGAVLALLVIGGVLFVVLRKRSDAPAVAGVAPAGAAPAADFAPQSFAPPAEAPRAPEPQAEAPQAPAPNVEAPQATEPGTAPEGDPEGDGDPKPPTV